MNTEQSSDFSWEERALDDLFEDESSEASVVERESRIDPTYRTTERVFRLLHLLTLHECTREEVFEHLRDFYHIGEHDTPDMHTSSKGAGRMLLRDIKFLQKMGYAVQVTRRGRIPLRYRFEKGQGPATLFLFNERELDILCLLHTLFADPTKYMQEKKEARTEPEKTLPPSSPRNPYAEDIIALIERLAASLPPEQRRHFDQWTRTPYVYFNMNPVTDYLPHRETIHELVRAISSRQQIKFDYTSTYLLEGTTRHERLDPYYIVYQEGHLYLVAYNHKTNRFYEYRVDRIVGGSIEPMHDTIPTVQRRRPITFRYWVYGNMAKGGLSHRWLSQTVEREEVYVENGQAKRKVLVLAEAYDEWRIIQQLQKYGDKVELVDPPELRKRMHKYAERIADYYRKESGQELTS